MTYLMQDSIYTFFQNEMFVKPKNISYKTLLKS